MLLDATTLLRRQRQTLHMPENANRMLHVVQLWTVWPSRCVMAYQSAMLRPQIDFISKQVALVAPIQML